MMQKQGWQKIKAKKSTWLVLLLLLALGIWFVAGGQSTDRNNKTQQFTAVEKGDIEETVTAQGKLEPKEYVDVGAQVSGQLKKLHVEIGDVVKKGDLIAEIDPKLYQSRVDADTFRLNTLKAQLLAQQSQATFAGQQLKRNEQLAKADAVSKETLEDAQNSLKMANAQVASYKAQIDEAQSTLEGDQANLSYTKIYAPMDGTVVSQTTREGQTVNASQSAPVIVQLANLDVMTVRAQVAEADVSRLKPDMDVYFTTLGSLERRWNGKVRQILPSPEVVNDVVLYNALVDVDNKDRSLMSGMSTQMFFVIGSAKDVPVIPITALGKRIPKEDNDKGQAYRVKLKGSESRVIHVGLMNSTLAEVRDGLALGEQVQENVVQTDSGKKGGPRVRGPRL